MRETSLALALATLSFLLAVIWGGPLLRVLRHFKIGKLIRVEEPGQNQVKMGTPTMGGVMIILPVAMLTVLAVQVSTGLISDDEIANTGPLVALVDGSWISAATSYHKGPGKLIVLALVGLHVAAIVFYQRVKKRRLVQAMVTGDQTVEAHPPLPEAADRGAHRLMALAVFALCAAATAWLVSLGG